MPEIGNSTVKADIDLVDETFDISQSESYHLSIQIEPDRLSFCVFNTVINKYVVLRNYPLFITDTQTLAGECTTVFENDHLLGLKYKSSCYLWVSPRSTLVPAQLFDTGNADLYFSFNHNAFEGEQILYHYVKTADLFTVFSCPETLISLLRNYQPNIRFFHQTAPIIESVIDRMSSSGQRIVALFFYSCYIDIVVAENKKLLFYNTFRINAPEDSVYYLVGVANMFEINLLSTRMLYAGSTKQMPPETDILKNYVNRITEFEPPNAVIYSHYILEPLRKSFINLFNLYGCES